MNSLKVSLRKRKLTKALYHNDAIPAIHLSNFVDNSLYTLVLLRHGESEWNSQNRYTGWCDVALTKQGEMEAYTAGLIMKRIGIKLDQAFTSILKRSLCTTHLVLNTLDQSDIPLKKSWRLNERHYGILQGFSKDTAYNELNIEEDLLVEIRRNYVTQPPKMNYSNPFWHGSDLRYKVLSKNQLECSRGESLKNTGERVLPYFKNIIQPCLKSGRKCLVVSHANTLRTLIKHLDDITDDNIKGLSIPTGIPLIYRLDKNLCPVELNFEIKFNYKAGPINYVWRSSRACGFRGVYLGDIDRLRQLNFSLDKTDHNWQHITIDRIARCICDDKLDFEKKCIIAAHYLYKKIQEKNYRNELENLCLVEHFKDYIDNILAKRRHWFLTMSTITNILEKINIEIEKKSFELFFASLDKLDRRKRDRKWYDMLVTRLVD